MLKGYLKKDGEHIIFEGHTMEAYIPEYYFQGKLAEDKGSMIEVFGLFNVRVFDGNGRPLKLETFNIPSMLHLYPTEMETKELELVDDVIEKYRVCKFYKGNRVLNKSIHQDASNVELFINLLFRGNIPRTIPYTQILQIWQKNLELNNVKLGVTSAILEVIITEIYRNKKKPEETFAKVIGKDPTASEFGYRPANIREICARNSTFAALTFEDIDSMITTSLNISKYNKEESQSPIEKIIKM